MAILAVLLHVAAATMLLLFSVRTVQKSIQSHAMVAMRRVFAGRGSRMKSASAGLCAAVLLQSSAAVALLTSTFFTSGIVGFAPALAAILGADLGSALVVLLLSFRVDWLLSICIALGGWMYLKSSAGAAHQIGRAILGVGLVLLSLQLLSDAFEPVRSSNVWPEIMAYLASDLLTAFMFGAVFAFVIHSSVATILMCVALANVGAIPLPVGIALTLGANLGSSLIPLWLTRGMPIAVRRIMIGNFALRGVASVLAILGALWIWPDLPLHIGSAGQTILTVHIAFNGFILLAIPMLGLVGTALMRAFPDPATAPDAMSQWHLETCLTPISHSNPSIALANIRRETQRMAQLVTSIAQPALGFFQTSKDTDRARLRQMDRALLETLDALRTYAADIDTDDLRKSERRDLRDLTDIAIDLTAAGHIVADRLMGFADTVHAERIEFSPEGWEELHTLNETVLGNMQLAFGALAQNDTALARNVVEAKSEVRSLERRSRKLHLQRLRDGSALSFDSSDIHLETLRALRELNSRITETVYPMLSRDGQLSDTRLVPHPK